MGGSPLVHDFPPLLLRSEPLDVKLKVESVSLIFLPQESGFVQARQLNEKKGCDRMLKCKAFVSKVQKLWSGMVTTPRDNILGKNLSSLPLNLNRTIRGILGDR